MQIVVGHANPDFDAYASTVAATKLFAGAKGIFLGSQNANVRMFHNLHEDFFDFIDLKGLAFEAVDRVVMVDTRDPDRVGELGDVVRRPGVEVIVYDHHPRQEGDIDYADDRSVAVGATTSILVTELRQRGIGITPLEASVMLLGIHEDTGSLTYPGATAYDAEAVAWLMASGADLEVVNQFLARTLEPEQRALLSQLTDSLEMWDVNGQQIAVGVATSDEYVDSAGVLSHYVVEDLGYRVAIAIVSMPDRIQVVARSRLSEVDVGAAMARLGGGGHHQAASAGFKDVSLPDVVAHVRQALEAEVSAPLRAADVMSSDVRSLSPAATMREAGELMARWGHGGVPILDDGTLVGLVTRKDVDKALRHGLAHAPVTGFMTRDIVTVGPSADVSELEQLMAGRGIGRVPVVESGHMVGIVTRKDVLRAEHGDGYLVAGLQGVHPAARSRFAENVALLLPEMVSETLEALGRLAGERGERAHAVGGFVRDMLLGRPNLDVDVVVEGDGVAFAQAFGELHGVPVKIHRRFGTAVLVVSREFHVDVTSARTEYYVRPGALPTVERSSLRQDLFRRDFTMNAMAACLEPSCFGAIADPFGGLRDLESGVVRVLHGLSFIDDPTRILRAVRFEERYGFSMDPGTESQARRAVELDMLSEVSGARLREEILGILAEESPASALERLDRIGALAQLLPEGAVAAALPDAVRAVEQALGAVGGLFARPPKERVALVAALSAGRSRVETERWLRHFRFGSEYAEASITLAERGVRVLAQLQDRRGMRDSRLYRLLSPLCAESIVNLWARGNDGARDRIDRFVRVLAGTRMAVSGSDLIALGATPSEAFSAILARALDDRLDGRAVGRRAELANLKRIAGRAGLIDPRKDPE
jgi:tRNA nucleotidyltransferase (CCA-adding enzyme)